MRTLTLLAVLLVTAAGCSQAERLARDAMDGVGSSDSPRSAGGWPPAAYRSPIDATGTWDTSWGAMTLVQDEDGRVTGTYEGGNSTIDAVNEGNVIRGYWTEPTSTRNCGTTRNGTPYWGRVTFVLVGPSRWSGRYTYCDATPGSADASWDGSR
jgi:hypothetical protein